MKKLIIVFIVIVFIGFGVYFFVPGLFSNKDDQKSDIITNSLPLQEEKQIINENQVVEQDDVKESIIGKSVEGRNITAYHYGGGDIEILFVGGIHGGYEWNTTLLAYEAMDYLEANLDVIPTNVKVTIIPVLNPDGLNKVVGTSARFELTDIPVLQDDTIAGRFNGNNVDLNRNFDCDWQSNGTWKNKSVSGGSEAFSEPESQAIKNYIENKKLQAVVIWYSAAGGVFSSNCHNGILTETRILTNVYADASGYPSYEEFDFYKITGDMANWLAKENIPAISILLTNHNDIEWDKNKAGMKALFEYHDTEIAL